MPFLRLNGIFCFVIALFTLVKNATGGYFLHSGYSYAAYETEVGQPLDMTRNVQDLWLIHSLIQGTQYWLSVSQPQKMHKMKKI